MLDEIGLADRLLELPHAKVSAATAPTPAGPVQVLDLHSLKTRFPFIAMMPQTRFLEFITTEAQRYPNFQLVFSANVHELIAEDGTVRGVRYQGRDGWHEVRAILTVGADGRFSRVRKLAGFEADTTSPPMDVLWLRVSKRPEELGGVMGRFGSGALLVDLKADLRAAIADIRQLVYGLRPPALDELGLVGALRAQVAHSSGPALQGSCSRLRLISHHCRLRSRSLPIGSRLRQSRMWCGTLRRTRGLFVWCSRSAWNWRSATTGVDGSAFGYGTPPF